MNEEMPRGPLRNRPRRAVIAIASASLVIVVVQVVATQTDHQVANMVSFVVAIMAGIYALIQLHLSASSSGRRYLVPAIVAVVLGGVFSVVRFDGFSGEMVPQFVSRFSKELELARVCALR